MPYSRNTFFNPDYKYKNAWSLTPQGRTITVSGFHTKSMHDTLSSSIPIFYILMFLAIAFDIYLGFSVLAKSGVNIMLIVGAIFFDFFFAVAPILLVSFFSFFNHAAIENKIFKTNLKIIIKRKNNTKHNDGLELELSTYKRQKIYAKIWSFIFMLCVFTIAGWKIYTYYSVLPPGFSIFSMVNGKIVIIFSFLCAVFHLIGSEKALAHFNFWLIHKKQYNSFLRGDIEEPKNKTRLPLDYDGVFKETSSGNTDIVVEEDGTASIEYINIIWDEEINDLIQHQTDQNAIRAIAIKCKENQL